MLDWHRTLQVIHYDIKPQNILLDNLSKHSVRIWPAEFALLRLLSLIYLHDVRATKLNLGLTFFCAHCGRLRDLPNSACQQ